MNIGQINELLDIYINEYSIEANSKDKHFVVVGGNMTANYVDGSLKLFSSSLPSKLNTKECDDFLKKCDNSLISLAKINYETWLEQRMKLLKKLGF